MSNEITSGVLAAALNHKVFSEAFEIARSTRSGILQVVNMSSPIQGYDGYKMGWLDMRIDAASDKLATTAAADATTLVMTDGSKFRAGMLLTPDASREVVLVTDVSGNNLTVERAFGGTVAAEITAGDSLTIDSVSREENSLAENDGIFQPENVENFFQTMDTAIEMSRRSLATLQYGNTNDLNFQLQERINQLVIQMDRALVNGRKAVAKIGGKDRTYSGGMNYWLDQTGAISTDNGKAALSLDAINNLNAEIVSRGGMANTIAVGIKQARVLQALVNSNYSSQRLSDWSNDSGALMRLPTDLPLIGNVNQIVIDTNLQDDELFIFDSGMISVAPMAQNNAGETGAWRTMDATQPGQDGERLRVVGDFAFEVRNSKTHMARLTNVG